MYYKTIHDVNDGFGGKTGACREYSYLVKIQIPNSLHGYHNMVQITLQKVVNKRIIQASGNHVRYWQAPRKLARHSRKLNRIWWTTTPRIFIPMTKGSGMMFLLMDDVRGKTLEFRISKWVYESWYDILTLKIKQLLVQFIANSMGPKLRHAFQKEGETASLILNGLIISGKEAIKLDFNIARTPTTFTCIVAPFKGIPEESSSRLNWWIMTPFHSDGKNFCITVFFTPWDPFGTKQKKNSTTSYRGREKCTLKVNGRFLRTQIIGSIWEKAQEKGLQFWQTRSHAIFLYDSVPADCIEKVVSLQGDKFFSNQRVSTPRSGLEVLKDAWQLTQQQQARHTIKQRATACGGKYN